MCFFFFSFPSFCKIIRENEENWFTNVTRYKIRKREENGSMSVFFLLLLRFMNNGRKIRETGLEEFHLSKKGKKTKEENGSERASCFPFFSFFILLKRRKIVLRERNRFM